MRLRRRVAMAVGRRKDSSNAITLDEQVQRFPALANAPRAQGMTSMDIGVSFQPLGTQIRNVRCMACQKWGHSKGDRDCEHQWDPFSGRASTMITQTKQQEEKEDAPLGESELHRSKSRRDRRDSSSSSEDSDSSSEESRRERKRRKKRKKHEDKAKRRKDSKHRKRSKSEDSEDQERSRRRKSSHKRDRKSHSRHDKSNK
jgi:hypothetical protein